MREQTCNTEHKDDNIQLTAKTILAKRNRGLCIRTSSLNRKFLPKCLKKFLSEAALWRMKMIVAGSKKPSKQSVRTSTVDM